MQIQRNTAHYALLLNSYIATLPAKGGIAGKYLSSRIRFHQQKYGVKRQGIYVKAVEAL